MVCEIIRNCINPSPLTLITDQSYPIQKYAHFFHITYLWEVEATEITAYDIHLTRFCSRKMNIIM